MRIVRIGLPALVGALLMYMAVQGAQTGLAYNGESAIDAFRGALVPAAIGVGLLLAAMAIAGRSRAGYWLGIGVAALMVLAGAWLIALEIPYMQTGGESAAFGTIGIGVAVVWMLVWAGYGLAFRRARASFAAAWQPGDRRFGIVLVALVIFTTGADLALGAIRSEAVANGAADEARAQELVNGTSLDVRVVDVAFEPGALTTGGPQAVAHLTLDVTVRAVEAYPLEGAPSLCLTDLATFRDPAYKPDVFCWGMPSPSGAVGTAFSDLSVPVEARTVRLVLVRGSSPCAFGPGVWSAELRIAPRLKDSGGIGPAPQMYARATSFRVEDGSAAPPSGTVSSSSACIASTVSP